MVKSTVPTMVARLVALMASTMVALSSMFAGALERVVGDLEQGVREPDRLGPLLARRGGVAVGELLRLSGWSGTR